MAWLLVQTVDEVDSKNFYRNLSLPKRGDVLHIHDERDSWAPGFIDPEKHVLIEVPGDAREFVEYLLPTPIPDLQKIPPTTQNRAKRLDLDVLGRLAPRQRVLKAILLARSKVTAEVADPAILLPELG